MYVLSVYFLTSKLPWLNYTAMVNIIAVGVSNGVQQRNILLLLLLHILLCRTGGEEDLLLLLLLGDQGRGDEGMEEKGISLLLLLLRDDQKGGEGDFLSL